LLVALAHDTEFANKGGTQLLSRLAALVGAKAKDDELARALALLVENKGGIAPWQAAVLDGLGQGLQNSGRSLRKLWEEPPASLKDAIEKAKPIFARAAETARTGKEAPERIAAVRLLASGPFAVASPALRSLLTPQTPAEIQLAAVRALAAQDHPQVGEMLLAGWNSYSPFVQREAAEAMLARPERVRQLLDAIGQKKISGGQLESTRLDQLRKHPNLEIRKRALEVLANLATPDRQKIVDDYKASLDLKSDALRGKMVFKRVCVTCHRLENEGVEVGPDLLSALKTKTRDGLIIDILDPSREVDPRYINYVVSTKDGRVLTGMIAVEAPSSITLRRAEKAEDSILRTQIEEIQATAKSLMPDELEKQITKQDLADLIDYLMSVAGRK
jgi:putative heme-binding domain-containing protein